MNRSRFFLYFTCFITGAVILILEMLGFRLLAPYFGYSVYVSGSLITIILATLSLGYYVGGRYADKYPSKLLLYSLIGASGLYLILILILYKVLLAFFQTAGVVWGAILSTAVLFAVPMVILSMVSPFLIKLLAHHPPEGSTELPKLGTDAGTIFAVSTVGSIAGSFFATFVLLPFFGSRATLALCIVLLVLVSTLGLGRLKKRYFLCLLVLFLLFIPTYSKADPDLVYETESAYNIIRIYDRNGLQTMTLNHPKLRQSFKPDFDHPLNTIREYREYFNLAPFITPVDSVLVLGMSAGASVQELRHFFNVSIDAVDIDPVVVALAKTYFNITEDARLTIFVEDAKTFIARPGKAYDFIEIDLFQGGEMPFYVVTKEFFGQVKQRLSSKGIVMMNVLGDYNDKKQVRLVRAVAETFAAVFPSVYLFPLRGNTILIATNTPTTREILSSPLNNVTQPQLAVFAKNLEKSLIPYPLSDHALVLTDDHAPIEHLSHEVTRSLFES